LEFFQVLEESTKAQEGAQQPSNQAEEKRSQTVGFPCPGSNRGAHGVERIWTIRSWSNYPTVVRSIRTCKGVKPSYSGAEETKVSKGIGASGISAFEISKVERSRGRDTTSLETVKDHTRRFEEGRMSRSSILEIQALGLTEVSTF
jgi:hypothetical protein